MTNPFACIANGTDRHFTHRGINCMTQLGPFSINGYIELPENHPWLDYPDTLEVHPDIEVHGGITYEADLVIGFDTSHFGDGHHPGAERACLTGDSLNILGHAPHIWTWEEVEAETRKLADQAKDTHTMTQPTRQEIITAYEALETLTDTCIHSSEQAEELQELVLRALPPKPQPTMAEEEWDDDKHYLAEAEHVSWGKMVMIYHDRFGSIRCAV
ncbi:hypothetical protein cauri_1947 [Corynebacterium aurimucosum ATCC 700975]|uniref:Uncharacterized protein n=3 Tax=Corynebacterium aurimucosum TaxID=169292 RepID=C3PI86_CORA7|nr:hypothetical protein [Corynebacterium aurimucosum]ACP33540.1 hypothetical protein cauri_1947 [Corynebacterium aurimucosum ATCC 700975]